MTDVDNWNKHLRLLNKINSFLFKYPMVFIHGLYFGSTEELNLAHAEGFLFELFKDTGLYPTTPHSTRINISALSDHSDYEHDEYENSQSRSSSTTIDGDETEMESSSEQGTLINDDMEADQDYPE